MRFLRSAWLCLGLCWLMPAMAAGQGGVGGGQLPTRADLNKVGLELTWWNQAVMVPQAERLRNVTVMEDMIYTQSTGGSVTAFDAQTGRRQWSQKLGTSGDPMFPMVANATQAFVVVGSKLHAINKRGGAIAWEMPIDFPPATGPDVDNSRLYIGSLEGKLFAYDLGRIRAVAERGALQSEAMFTEAWRFGTGAAIVSAPLIYGTRITVASKDGSIYTISNDGGKLLYQFETDGPISAPIAQAGELILIASTDNSLHCIQRTTGKTVWSFVTANPILDAPVVIGGKVYITSTGEGLFCLDVKTGHDLWHQPAISSFLTATADMVYGLTPRSEVAAVDLTSGRIKGSIVLKNMRVAVPNSRTDRIVIASPNGVVVCLNQIGRSAATFHMYPDLQPIEPVMEPEEGAASAANEGTAGGEAAEGGGAEASDEAESENEEAAEKQ